MSRRSPNSENVSKLADVCGLSGHGRRVARALSPGCKVDTVLIPRVQGARQVYVFRDSGG